MTRLALLLLTGAAVSWAGSAQTESLGGNLRRQTGATPALSLNVSTCPGYALSGVANTKNGFAAKLSLAGPACNAFGLDVQNLTLEVTYETKER